MISKIKYRHNGQIISFLLESGTGEEVKLVKVIDRYMPIVVAFFRNADDANANMHKIREALGK